jgi:hypothetical protein
MDTQTYNENLCNLVLKYIEDNNLDIDYSKFELTNDGMTNSLSIISKWNYPITKPTKENLENLDLNDVIEKASTRNLLDNLQKIQIPIANQGQLNKLKKKDISKGTLVFNETLKKLQIFDNNWTNI